MSSTSLANLRTALHSAKNVIAVAGAGLSAASGIPTFRGAGGFWRSLDAMSLATPEAFEAHTSTVWQFYHYRREKAASASPNAAHYALAQLCIPEKRQQLLPNAQSFTLITQNVDGLSGRALREICHGDMAIYEAASHNMIEMHGRLFETLCTVCDHRELNLDSPICSALREAESDAPLETLPDRPDIPLELLPRCSQEGCGSLTRPGVVWFGEVPLELKRIDALVATADLCLVVGTSSTVYPAAGYAGEVQDNGGKVVVFNLERSSGDEDADFLLIGPCEKTLPTALQVSETP